MNCCWAAPHYITEPACIAAGIKHAATPNVLAKILVLAAGKDGELQGKTTEQKTVVSCWFSVLSLFSGLALCHPPLRACIWGGS